mmetsp:Transcript_43830/g.80042  ORF Transcript_43830/g.80042 Transcript_43830/m.80042 type:complete len:216 (-) Transcript_43830:372-1019(-)
MTAERCSLATSAPNRLVQISSSSMAWCMVGSSSPAVMSFAESRRKGINIGAKRDEELNAVFSPPRRSSGVMPILSPLGGLKVIGKYDVIASKSCCSVSLDTHEGSRASISWVTSAKDKSRFRGSLSSSTIAAMPSPRALPNCCTSSLQSSRSTIAVSSMHFRTACVCEGVCTSLSRDLLMLVTLGTPSSLFKVRRTGPCRVRRTLRPAIAPSTHW